MNFQENLIFSIEPKSIYFVHPLQIWQMCLGVSRVGTHFTPFFGQEKCPVHIYIFSSIFSFFVNQTERSKVFILSRPQSSWRTLKALDPRTQFPLCIFSFRISFKRRETKKLPKSPLNKTDSNGSQASSSNGNGGLLEPAQNQNPPGPLQAKIIRATSVKPKTLTPKWHERFRL